jgi:hypothetical protein
MSGAGWEQIVGILKHCRSLRADILFVGAFLHRKPITEYKKEISANTVT